MKLRNNPMCLGGCVFPWGMAGTYLVSLDSLTFFLLQGVEFFDEKLNSLCMAWLVDHGASPAGWGRVLVLQEGYMGIG